MIKGGWLAWLLSREGGVVVDAVDHRGSISLAVYRREEGEETINTKHTDATKKHNKSTRGARVLKHGATRY